MTFDDSVKPFLFFGKVSVKFILLLSRTATQLKGLLSFSLRLIISLLVWKGLYICPKNITFFVIKM